jgi:lipopolysaccharide export LptBFGC system permease protein LptF
LEGRLQPELAAWLPVLLFGALGLASYDGIRT